MKSEIVFLIVVDVLLALSTVYVAIEYLTKGTFWGWVVGIFFLMFSINYWEEAYEEAIESWKLHKDHLTSSSSCQREEKTD